MDIKPGLPGELVRVFDDLLKGKGDLSPVKMQQRQGRCLEFGFDPIFALRFVYDLRKDAVQVAWFEIQSQLSLMNWLKESRSVTRRPRYSTSLFTSLIFSAEVLVAQIVDALFHNFLQKERDSGNRGSKLVGNQ